MGKRIVRLEQALRVWEDICYILAKNNAFSSSQMRDALGLSKNEGPLIHYSELRQHIIEKAKEGNFDYKRFVFSEVLKGTLLETGSLPKHLFAWNHYSRRVYQLNKDLQTLLSATSLDGIYWREIKWPFKSFVLMLEEPLSDDTGRQFDCIVVSEVGKIEKYPERDKCEIFDFLVLSTELDRYKPLDKKKLDKALARKKWDSDKMARKGWHIGSHFMESFFQYIYHDPKRDTLVNIPFKESIKDYQERSKWEHAVDREMSVDGEKLSEDKDSYLSYGLYDKAAHLVASTCLYLATLPPKILPEKMEDERREEMSPELSPAAVTEAKKIFYIQCESALSKESQETISAIRETRFKRQIRPHWRRGHWRRIPGGKSMENAPRHWIPPCLVNKDKPPPSSLPVSSRTTLE